MSEHEAVESNSNLAQLLRCIRVTEELFEILSESAIPAAKRILKYLYSHRSTNTEGNTPSLSASLEAVDLADLSKAMLKLSAFSNRVNGLKDTRSSEPDEAENEDLLERVPTIPISRTLIRESKSVTVQSRVDIAPLQYKYGRLKEGEIRILELFPGARKEPVSFRLIHVPLEDAGNFEAVSYTWGIEEPTCPIQIDGGSLLVRPNLEAALIEFRAGSGDPGAISEPFSFELLRDPQITGLDDDKPAEISKRPVPDDVSGNRSSARRLWIDAICIDQRILTKKASRSD
jgi:hypothetical protein